VAVAHKPARTGQALALELVVARELRVLLVLDDLHREEADEEDREADGNDE
jgi:hypothetical protein